MHKVLLLLGMLLGGPLYGYQLHQIVRAHGELYADLKKANLYYLLERLAKEGYLETEVETGARGIRGERVIYTLTEQGRARFKAGKNLQDILSFFRAPSGRPPFEEFGGMATLAAESSGWLKLDLEPGNYAVLSAIPDPHTGVFQLVQGLLAAFTVH